MRDWNIRVVVLALGLVILLVEGFFIYRFYTRDFAGEVTSKERGSGTTSIEGITTPAETTAAGKTVPEAPAGVSFVHRATPGNTIANSTFLDNPYTNDNPNAILLVTQVSDSNGDKADNPHEIGVWYYARGGRWAIYNQDRAPMSENAVFNVIVLKGPGAIVHHARAGNTSGDVTYIDNPLTNGDPKALLSVTQNWNPGGGTGVYNDHPVGVRYDAGLDRWGIFNRDHEPIPPGSSFNVAVSKLPG